jgi:DUF971 family protein
MRPTKIKLSNDSEMFLIKWDDQTESEIPLLKLRRLCPCATCLSERENQSKSYIPLFNKNQLKISSIKPVGSYALGITWGDGHNTGIYEFPFLKKLSDEFPTPENE